MLVKQLVAGVEIAGLPPYALLDAAHTLISVHAAIADWQAAGAPPDVDPSLGSKQRVRESLGQVVELLRTFRLM